MAWLVALAVVVVVAVIAVIVAVTRSRGAREPVSVAVADIDGIVSEPVPIAPEIRWTSRVAPSGGPFDDAARLKLINDLGFLRAAWCVPVLTDAYREERDPALRRAALDALEACDPDAALALRRR